MSGFGDRTTDDIRLVHGTYLCGGTCLDGTGHAWVEIGDDVVFDGVVQRFYDRASYYRVQGATKSATYSVEEAGAMLLREYNWGPWHDETVQAVAP